MNLNKIKHCLIENIIKNFLLLIITYLYLTNKISILFVFVGLFFIINILFYILKKRKIWLYSSTLSKGTNILITLITISAIMLGKNKIINIWATLLVVIIICITLTYKDCINQK